MLTAYYDLSTSPASYDYVSFLLACELWRQRLQETKLKIFILPGPNYGFREDKLPPFFTLERQQLLDKVVVPMSQLLPACVSCAVTKDRSVSDDANFLDNSFGFNERHYGLHILLEAARANIYPLRHPSGVRQDKGYITITIRACNYWPTRNSRMREWRLVANVLEEKGYKIIVVNDTSQMSRDFYNFEVSPIASDHLLQRVRLYENATLNLFINNGPAWLCLFLGVPTYICKLTSPDAPCVNDEFYARYGFHRGDTWPNLQPRQMVSWQDDIAEKILPEIQTLLESGTR